MTDKDAGPSLVSSAVIVDELIRLGVREAVVCPGSRSAPLSRAFAQADAEGRLRLHVRTDERTAAFLALGMATTSGRITPVVVTSGTAVANLQPAMVEATYSSVPLLALTADRPASYQGTAANQTIRQDLLFEHSSVWEGDVDGTSDLDTTSAARLRARIDRMAATMLQRGTGGAGHLNVRLVEPLVPEENLVPAIPEGRPDGAPWVDIRHTLPDVPLSDESSSTNGVFTVDVSAPTLVIAGDGAPYVGALAEVPTIAEPTATAPDRPVHPLAAQMFTAAAVVGDDGVLNMLPKNLVVLGRPTLHRDVGKLLADPRIDVTIVTSGGYPGAADFPDVSANARRTVSAVTTVGEPTEEWLRICDAASNLAAEAVRDVLFPEDTSEDVALTGLHAAAAVTDSLRTDDLLVLGASNPVRDASLAGLPFPGVDVHANRGAAGIDGTVSTAVGAALVRDRLHPDAIRPPRTIALMGDLTFLHDVSGLNIGPGEPRPENLTIVVANDSGGGIFETLEPGRPALRDGFERIFGTPHLADIQSLCDAYIVDYRRADSLPELLAELHPDTDVEGIRVIEFRTERGGLRDLHGKLKARTRIGGGGAGVDSGDGAGSVSGSGGPGSGSGA